MKNALSVVGVVVVAVLLITAIFGIGNAILNSREQVGSWGYYISRPDFPFGSTSYNIRWSGPCAGFQQVEKRNLSFYHVNVESYSDDDGDGKVDTIYIGRTGQMDIYLTGEDRENPLYAKEFLEADLILLQAKLRFYDRIIAIELKRALGIGD